MKKFLEIISGIIPVVFWEKIEYASAYFAGKGSGSASLEPEVTAALHSIKSAGEHKLVVFDVGTNKGDWTAEMLRQAGSRIEKIYQFEPSPHNIVLLKERYANDPRVNLVPFAVSDKKGSAELFSDVPGSGIASLHKRNLEHFNISMEDHASVEMITIDDFILKENITRVDFMKMDIEGHELAALHGAKKALTDGIIRGLSFEFGGANIDSRTYFQDFWYFLTPLGYELFRILPNGSTKKIGKYSEMLEAFRTTNYIAVRQ
jgi:FkbM family methyltransferase